MATRRRLCKHAPPRSDSESDEDMLIPLSSYTEAEIGSALRDKERFCRAVHELSEVLALCSRASKAVQKQCVADTISAIGLCDWSELQARALAKLVGSIEQHLPKAKREACLRECKQAKLSHHRKVKKAAGKHLQSPIDLLPDHLLVLIFANLAPPDLSRAACVSRKWDELVGADDCLWQSYLLEKACGHRASDLFRGNDRLTSMWQSRRIVIDGELAWAGRKDILMCSSGAYYPIPIKMVIASMLGRRNFLKALRGSSDSESDNEAEVQQGGMWRFSPLPATPPKLQ